MLAGEVFVIQLLEAREEWKRRHPKEPRLVPPRPVLLQRSYAKSLCWIRLNSGPEP